MTKPKPRIGRPPQDPGLDRWHGSTLRVLRQSKELSARQLAEAIGFSKSAVLRWERSEPGNAHAKDRNPPTKEQLRALAVFFKVTQVTFSRVARVVIR